MQGKYNYSCRLKLSLGPFGAVHMLPLLNPFAREHVYYFLSMFVCLNYKKKL